MKKISPREGERWSNLGGFSLRSPRRSPKRFKIVRANEGRACWSKKTRRGPRGRARRDDERWAREQRGRGGGGLPYRTNRRAVKSIARYFAPPRAASFRREILLTSFRVPWTQPPSSLPFSFNDPASSSKILFSSLLFDEIHFLSRANRKDDTIIQGRGLV